jgi:hypothetical protein
VPAKINEYYNRGRLDEVVETEDIPYEDYEAFLATYMVKPEWDDKEKVWRLSVENVREGCDRWRPRPWEKGGK